MFRVVSRSFVFRAGPLLLASIALACGEQRLTTPPSRGHIAVSSGDRQLGKPGEQLGQPIVVIVRDAAGAPIAGIHVRWMADDGGTIDPAESITDAEGRAVASWTLGTAFSAHHARALADGYAGAEFVASASLDGVLPLDVIEPMTLQTYDGSGQTVHPDFVATGGEWPAAREYLFITPYPAGNPAFENPSMFEGLDPRRWNAPADVTNPIMRPTDGYLSDPDAVYVAERGELWLYFRQVSDENVVRLTTSRDAVHWSAPVTVARAPNHELISPSVVRHGASEWMMWAVNGNVGCAGASAKVELRRSANGLDWSAPQSVDLVQPGLWPWHIDVQWIPSRGEFWAMYNAKTGGSCTTGAVYLATSLDGVHWTTYPSPVLAHGVIPELQDVVYRSTFAYDPAADELTIWYSGARYDGGKYIWRSAVQRRRREDVLATIRAPSRAAMTADRMLPAFVNFP